MAKKGDMFDAKRVYLSERKKEQVSVDAQVWFTAINWPEIVILLKAKTAF